MDQIIGQILDYAVQAVTMLSTGWLAGWGLGAIFAILITLKEKIRDLLDR